MAAEKEHKNSSQEKVKYHLGFTAMSVSRQECGMLCLVDLCCVPSGLNSSENEGIFKAQIKVLNRIEKVISSCQFASEVFFNILNFFC